MTYRRFALRGLENLTEQQMGRPMKWWERLIFWAIPTAVAAWATVHNYGVASDYASRRGGTMKRILGVLIVAGLLAVPVLAQEKVTRGGEPTPTVDARPGGFCIIAYGEDFDDDADPATPDVYRQVWDVQVYQLLNGYSSARYGRDVTITREQLLAGLTPTERQALRSIALKAFAYVAAQLGESTTADDDAGKGVGGDR